MEQGKAQGRIGRTSLAYAFASTAMLTMVVSSVILCSQNAYNLLIAP
jgi:hypothetical protein